MLHNLLSTMSNDDNSISNDKSSNRSSNEESKATLLVNSAICNSVSPAHIRRLLLVPEKNKPLDKSKSNNKILANKNSTS